MPIFFCENNFINNYITFETRTKVYFTRYNI